MRKQRFLRSDTMRHLRLGKKRRKLQKWRRPRGRHSKIRRKRFSYPVKVSIGYKSSKSTAGMLSSRIPVLVHSLRELETLTPRHVAVIARVGAKKKLGLIKRAQERKIALANVRGGA